MILQDNDPHHMHPDMNYVYYFLILAVIIGAAMLFGAMRFMKYLDNRYERKQSGEKDAKTESGHQAKEE